MFDEMKFPDISHLTRVAEKYGSVLETNSEFWGQFAAKLDEIVIKGTLDVLQQIDTTHRIKIDLTKFRWMAIDIAKVALGASFAIGREYAETYPEKALNCRTIKNLDSVLLLDSTKEEIRTLSQYAHTPMIHLLQMIKQNSLMDEKTFATGMDLNSSTYQDSMLFAFQAGIFSFYFDPKNRDSSMLALQSTPEFQEKPTKIKNAADLIKLLRVTEEAYEVTPELRGKITKNANELVNNEMIPLMIRLQKSGTVGRNEVNRETDRCTALIYSIAMLAFFIGAENGLSHLGSFSVAHYIDMANQILVGYIEILVTPLKIGGILKGKETDELVSSFSDGALKSWNAAKNLGIELSTTMHRKNDSFLNALSALE